MLAIIVGLLCTATITQTVAQSQWDHYLEVYPNDSSKVATPKDESTPLYFGLMLSLSGDQQSTGALAGVQAALDHINSRDDLLPGYSLHYTLTDSKCDRTVALDGLFTQLFQPPQEKVALIGSGCSTATEATAEVSKYFNITQISCASSSDELSDRVRFPYYFQLLPSEVNLARVFYNIIKEYGWRRVTLIIQKEQRYKATMRFLMDIESEPKVTYSEVYFADEIELDKQLRRNLIFDSNFRVYIFAMNVGPARCLICEAHRLGMKYPKYVFLTYGSYDYHWWAVQGDDSCSSEDRAEVLQFSLAVLHYNTRSRETQFYGSCHDATWTLAYALSKSLNESRELANRREEIPRHAMVKYLEDTNFVGISGLVNFNEKGIRVVTEMTVLQYRTSYANGTPTFDEESATVSSTTPLSQKLKLIKVAYYMRKDDQRLQFISGDKNKIWPDLIPFDGAPKQEIVTLVLPVTIILSFLNICGIICGVVCLLFNIVFRRKRLIRLDSPNLNYVIISGTITIYIGCTLLLMPTTSPTTLPRLCIVRACLVAIGYSLGFGTMIAKLLRIYLIFRVPKNTKRIRGIKDWHLMLIVLGFILVDVILLVIYMVLEGVITHFNAGTAANEERPSQVDGELEIQTNFMVYTCSTNPWIRRIVLGILHFYKGLLQLSALFFAFQTRKVKIEGLNNTKYITALVYATSIIIALTALSLLTLSKYINIYAFMYSFAFWLANSLLLGLLFVPKMVSLYRDPGGDTVFTAHNHALEIQTTTVSQRDTDSDIDALKQRIKTLEDQLMKEKEVTKVVEPVATSVRRYGNKHESKSHTHQFISCNQ